MVFYQRLNSLKLKISSIASNGFYYAIILASLVLAFYFIPFIILFIFSLIFFRKKIKWCYLLIILGLFLLSYFLYYLVMHLNYKFIKAKVIMKVKTEYGYKYLIRSGLYRYVFYYNKELNIGSIIKLDYSEYVHTKPKTPYGADIGKYYFGLFIKAKLKVNKLTVLATKESLLGRYLSIYPKYSQEWLMLFLKGQNYSLNNFIYFLDQIKLLRLIFYSGIHVMFLIKVLKKVFFITSLKKVVQDYLLLIILFLLMIMTNSVTVKRYFFSYLLVIVFSLSKKETLSASFIILTIFFPNQIYTQSYIIGFSFILLASIFNRYLSKFNPYLKVIISYYLYFILLLPIILRFYNRFNLLMFLLAPLVIASFKYFFIPLTYLLLVFPPLAVISEPLFIVINNLFSKVNFINYSFAIPVINYFFLALIYLGFFLLLRFNKLAIKIAIPIIISSLFIVSYFQFYLSIFSKTYFFNVGQGNFSLVYNAKNKETLAVDLFGETLDILDKMGVRKIEHLIITHSDKDHYDGYHKIKDYINIKNIYLSPTDKYPLLNHRPKNIEFNKEYGNKHLKFIFYQGEIYKEKNDNSLIIKVINDNKKTLYTGDISDKVERDLISKYKDQLSSDLLMIPHHGSCYGSTKEFIQIVNPKVGIISCGEHNSYHHPGVDVVRRYLLNKTKLYYTFSDNTIVYFPKFNKVISHNLLSFWLSPS